MPPFLRLGKLAFLRVNFAVAKFRLEIGATEEMTSAAEAAQERARDGGAEAPPFRKREFPEWEKWRRNFGAGGGALPDSFIPAAR
jgi:hypothetical protein